MRSSILWTKRWTVFYDDNGKFLDKKKVKRKDTIVEWNDETYNISIGEGSITEIECLWFNKEYYHYVRGNPNPLKLNKKCEPIINARLYNIQLNTHLAEELNNLSNDWKKLITPRNIIIFLVIVGIIVYLFMGGKIIPTH